jgi:phage terminase small subunit
MSVEMAPLTNHKHEAFCLAYIAQQGNSVAAYSSVYPDATSATARTSSFRFLKRDDILARLEELRTAVAAVVVEKTGIDEARIVNEVARVAFSRADQVASWAPEVVETIDEDEERGIVTITRTIHNRVTLVASDKMSEDAMAAIAAVSLTANGTLSVKMHPKIPALVALMERFKPAPAAIEDNSVTNNFAFIDGPPRETFEQWEERTRRARDSGGERGSIPGGALAPPTRPTSGRG